MSSWDPGYGTLPLQKNKKPHVPFEARHRAWSSTEAVPIPTPSSKSSGCLFWHWQLIHWALKEKVGFTPWKIKGWNLQITHLERKMIFQTSMIRFHVNLQGCNVGTVDGRNPAFTGWYGKFTASTGSVEKRTFLTNSLYLGKQTAGYHHLLTAGIEKFPPNQDLTGRFPQRTPWKRCWWWTCFLRCSHSLASLGKLR